MEYDEQDCSKCEEWRAKIAKARQNLGGALCEISESLFHLVHEPLEKGRGLDESQHQGTYIPDITVTVRVNDKSQNNTGNINPYRRNESPSSISSPGSDSANNGNIGIQNSRPDSLNMSGKNGNEGTKSGRSKNAKGIPVFVDDEFNYDETEERRVLRPRENLRKRCTKCNMFHCTCKYN